MDGAATPTRDTQRLQSEALSLAYRPAVAKGARALKSALNERDISAIVLATSSRNVLPRRLGLGKLYRRTGKHEQAQEHLSTATTMYREMGMTYWLEQAEAEF